MVAGLFRVFQSARDGGSAVLVVRDHTIAAFVFSEIDEELAVLVELEIDCVLAEHRHPHNPEVCLCVYAPNVNAEPDQPENRCFD